MLYSLLRVLIPPKRPILARIGTEAFVTARGANSGFELDELFCTACYYPAITGWWTGPNSGVQNNNPDAFPGGLPGGMNFAWLVTAIQQVLPPRQSKLPCGPTPHIL